MDDVAGPSSQLARSAESETTMSLLDLPFRAADWYIGNDDMICVVVGPARISFYVDTAAVCADSGFFRTALEKGWEETSTKFVVMPEDDPDLLTVFLNWVYTRRLDLTFTDAIGDNNTGSFRGENLPEPIKGKAAVLNDTAAPILNDLGAIQDGRTIDVQPLVDLYIFADKIQSTTCKVAVIQRLHEAIGLIDVIYTHTCVQLTQSLSMHDGLLALVRDWFLINVDQTKLAPSLFDEAPRFAERLVKDIISKSEVGSRGEWMYAPVEAYVAMVERELNVEEKGYLELYSMRGNSHKMPENIKWSWAPKKTEEKK